MGEEGWCGVGLREDVALYELGTVWTVLELMLEIVCGELAVELELSCLKGWRSGRIE